MKRTITTLADAKHLVSDWTENYLEQPTDEQVERAARALVAQLGGYGHEYDSETTEFDLDQALGE